MVIFSKAKNIKAKNKLINQKTGEKKNKMRQQTSKLKQFHFQDVNHFRSNSNYSLVFIYYIYIILGALSEKAV